jgi:menaquinone-9 beta-reductase
MKTAADVAIVGGGIAGASLAHALASEGLGVTVLESTIEYQDRARGETINPWGVNEARILGVEPVLLGAGGHVSPALREYVEGYGEPTEISIATMVPGIPGALNLRYTDACKALIDSAARAGARVVHGAREVRIVAGPPVSVVFNAKGVHEVTAALVVGADGRASAVRRQAGITLVRQPPLNYAAGLLVEGLDDVPNQHDLVVSANEVLFVMLRQTLGRARIYLFGGLSGRHRFSGRDAAQRFLAACNLSFFPWGRSVAAGTAAGPCVTYLGDDAWTHAPYAPGVVLVGDAAGHNNPIIGQGLSIALRDVRIVRDLVLAGARGPSGFLSYGEERSRRMERLRLVADVISVARAEDADNRSARRTYFQEILEEKDSEVSRLLRGVFAGPETIPDEVVQFSLLDRIRGAPGRP